MSLKGEYDTQCHRIKIISQENVFLAFNHLNHGFLDCGMCGIVVSVSKLFLAPRLESDTLHMPHCGLAPDQEPDSPDKGKLRYLNTVYCTFCQVELCNQ